MAAKDATSDLSTSSDGIQSVTTPTVPTDVSTIPTDSRRPDQLMDFSTSIEFARKLFLTTYAQDWEYYDVIDELLNFLDFLASSSDGVASQAFQLIDSNKDGLIDKNDLRATFDSLGRIVSETDLNNMLAEAPGPINFTMFLTIFGERISGTDQEEVIKKAFKTFDPDGAGKINEKKLRKALITWGEKLNNAEVDEAFKEAPMDRDGMIDINSYVKIICGTAVDEE